jgi:hypothetical protein
MDVGAGNCYDFDYRINISVQVLFEPGFDVLTAVSTKMAVFWVVAPCSLVEVYQRFRGPCCLRHSEEYLNARQTKTLAK